MQLLSILVLLVLSVVVESCDEEVQYEAKSGECCKMCGKGTKMTGNNCTHPVCEECKEGEYRDTYTRASVCETQPQCDSNLNLQKQPSPLSKTERVPCPCKPEHHCANVVCDSCVRNTVCKAGEKLSKIATKMTDVVCEPCPIGTFSDHESASTCKPWTHCSFGYTEAVSGSSQSDRQCEWRIAVIVASIFVVVILALVIVGYVLYKRGYTGSITFLEKACTICFIKNHKQPAPDNEQAIENGPQPGNQPQEDTEDLLKLDTVLTPGISEKGMPVIQDHSKSLLLSETETEPGSFLGRF